MTDLTAQIRERLDIAPDIADGILRMRDALEAVVAAVATPGFLPPNGCGCSACVGGWILAVIAEKLGIEATTDD